MDDILYKIHSSKDEELVRSLFLDRFPYEDYVNLIMKAREEVKDLTPREKFFHLIYLIESGEEAYGYWFFNDKEFDTLWRLFKSEGYTMPDELYFG